MTESLSCVLHTLKGLTLSHGGELILHSQHEFGLPGEVLAASLLMLQGNGNAPRQVVYATDHRWVCISLQWAAERQSTSVREVNRKNTNL